MRFADCQRIDQTKVMSQNEILEKIRSVIDQSIQDDVLMRGEKREIKELMNRLSPDKALCDVLRSEIFDLANKRIDESNYSSIMQWIEDMNKLIIASQKLETVNERVYFSPGEDCLNAILYQIKNASKMIQICLFTISDNRISDEVISKHRQGVPVNIITDNDKLYDTGSDIKQLSRSGIPVKVDVTDNHMHHKFALFDKTTTITGSYNWTRSAEKYNHENIIITDSDSMIREFEREFDKLWEECIFYDGI